MDEGRGVKFFCFACQIRFLCFGTADFFGFTKVKI